MSYVKNLDINGASYDIKAIAVNDINGGSALKTWTGTKEQYEAITTKDSNTLYNITDDTDVTLSLLELLYPVGSLYIGSGNLSACPLSVLGVGTWVLKSNNAIVTDVSGIGSTVPVKGTGKTLGLTDGTNNVGLQVPSSNGYFNTGFATTNYDTNIGSAYATPIANVGTSFGVTTDGSKSGIVADLSNVSTTTLTVKIWERTA